MKEKLEALLKDGIEKIKAAKNEAELQEIKSALLGKAGRVTLLMKEMPKLSPEERPEAGKLVNKVKNQLSELIDGTREELKLKASEVSPDFDCTVPGIPPISGGLHPITQMCYDLNDAFHSMGFEIFESTDISSELYSFDKLNFPPNHPARESMDTYWLEGHDSGRAGDKLCLRPHLTGDSVRYLQTHKAPYRFVYPGRVYRNETTDARHERAFYQYEALIVDKDFTFVSGKVLIQTILSKVFGRHVDIRMRSGFFPFVEPGYEIDMSCLVCGGNELYLGDPKGEYMVYLKVLSTKKVGEGDISDKIHVSLVSTDSSLDPMRRIKKQGIKNGLYNALDVGSVWLQSELEK